MSIDRRSHVPGLDGLRGLAIIGVVVVHTLNSAPFATRLDFAVGTIASLGWMGVDLFFVLSGFLITGILIDQRERPDYFRTFFWRRVLRILPAYVVFLCVALVIAPRIDAIDPAVAARLVEQQGWYWTYLVNVMLVVQGWAVNADAPTHLWSLAVEEQFYLLWPFVVLAVSPRALPRVALACIATAALCRVGVVLAGAPSVSNYVLLPMRMDTLAMGALLACAVREPSLARAVNRSLLPALGIAIMSLLAVAAIGHSLDSHNSLMQVLGYPAIALLAAVFVWSVSQSPSLFAVAPLRWLGRYSYGIYLYHWLAVALLRRDTGLFQPRLIGGSYLAYYSECVVAALAASSGLALVSWTVIESPFLRLKRLVPYGPVSGGAGETALDLPLPAE